MTHKTRLAIPLALGLIGAASCRNQGASELRDVPAAGQGACAAAVPTLKQFDPVEGTGAAVLERVFEVCLREAIRIDTQNPPGNEHRAAQFFGEIFQAVGIPHRVIEVEGQDEGSFASQKRVNLLAGYPALAADGASEAPRGIVLMNHMDVVGFVADQWRYKDGERGPLSGARFRFDGEDVIYGRGAIDMKNIGIMQALTMALLKLHAIELPVPVYFAATADEEDSSIGVRGLLAEARPGGKAVELVHPYVVLNEGGFGIRGALGQASTLHAIGTEERGGAWLRVGAATPDKVLAALASLSLLPTQRGAAAMRPALSCKLTYAKTPNAKANVVPSVVELRLACQGEPTPDAVKAAFDTRSLWRALKGQWLSANEESPATIAVEKRATDGQFDVKISTATAGHGSSFAGLSALDVTAWGLQMTGAVPVQAEGRTPAFFNYQISPATKRLLTTAAAHHDLLQGNVPAVHNLDRILSKIDTVLGQVAFKALATRFGIDKLFRTNCTWTGFAFDEAHEVAPEAVLDCRIIDLEPVREGGPSHPERLMTKIEARWRETGVEGVAMRLLTGWNFTASPSEGPLYDAIASVLEQSFPGSIATPYMIPGGTDSTYTRDPSLIGGPFRGAPSYGITPAVVTVAVVSTFHGSDERFPVSELAPSVDAYVKLVRKLAGVAR